MEILVAVLFGLILGVILMGRAHRDDAPLEDHLRNVPDESEYSVMAAFFDEFCEVITARTRGGERVYVIWKETGERMCEVLLDEASIKPIPKKLRFVSHARQIEVKTNE
jgi:hypothetical protein